MERKRSEYATAYKLSNAVADPQSKTTMRLKRRSIEQRQGRYDEMSKKRNLQDLSPLHEADSTLHSANYDGKTPNKSAYKADNNKKGQSRLEQLKKWKDERNKRRAMEEKQRKPTFKVSANITRDTDKKLFKKSPLKKHPVKPVVPVLEPVSRPAPRAPVTQKSKPAAMTSDKTSRQPSGPSTRTRGTRQPAPPPPSTRASTRVTRQTVKKNEEKNTRTTKTSIRETSMAAKKQGTSGFTKVNTQRGRDFDFTNSTFPSQDTFDASSFVFQPMSPRSASEFLCPGINSSCSSFLENVPNRISTPKKDKNQDRTVISVSNVSTCNDDTIVSQEMSSVLSDTSRPVRRSSRLSTRSSTNTSLTSEHEVSSVKPTDTSVRRSTRQSVKSISESIPEEPASVTLVHSPANRNDKPYDHESSEITNNSSNIQCGSSTKPDKNSPVAVAKTSSRRSLRRSILKSQSAEEGSNSEEEPKSARKTSRKSVVIEEPVVASPAKSSRRRSIVVQSPAPVTTEPTSRRRSVTTEFPAIAKEEKPTTRRRSVNIVSPAPKLTMNVQSPASNRRRSTRASVGSAVETTEPVQIETPTRSSRRSSRRSIAIVPETETIPEAEIEAEVLTTTTRPPSSAASAKSPTAKSSPVKAAAESSLAADSDSNQAASSGSPKPLMAAGMSEEGSEASDSNDEVFTSTGRIAEPRYPTRTPRNSRNKSFGGFRLPNADSAVFSGKRSAKRKSMLPKSPEEWVELLKNSPMVEMSRRKSKPGVTPVPTLNFDEHDVEEVLGMSICELNKSQEEHALNMSHVDPNTSHSELNVPKVDGEAEVAMETESKCSEHVVQSGTTPSKPDNAQQPTVQVGEVSSTQDDSGSEEINVPYFRRLVISETRRLTLSSEHWTNINNTTQGLSDEIQGQIRTTVGQAHLLMNQRFAQFSGLVDNCEFNLGEKETTCTDLKGFWDMIYFQVEDVDAKFLELMKLQENNWVDDKPKPVVKKVKKKVTKPATSKPVVKSKFASFRAQMKKQQEEAASRTLANVTDEEKTFEMPGFFKVTSPVRTPKFHCEGGTPKKATPSSTSTGTSNTASSENQGSTDRPVLKDSLVLASGTLLRHTPTRKSYVPVVPSPLLQDTTPAARPARTCTTRTPRFLDLPSGEVETPTRNLRSRKSVNFTEPTEQSVSVAVTDVEPKDPASSEGTDEDFLRLLQPTGARPARKRPSQAGDPFENYVQSTQSEEPPRKSRRSSLKSCRSTERRRSTDRRRSRSVHFNSQDEDLSHTQLPHTPFNSNSLVKQRRVSHSSVSKASVSAVEDDIFSIDNVDNDENIPPPSFRSPRPSLLGTPPALSRGSKVNTDVPTATLISFTP